MLRVGRCRTIHDNGLRAITDDGFLEFGQASWRDCGQVVVAAGEQALVVPLAEALVRQGQRSSGGWLQLGRPHQDTTLPPEHQRQCQHRGDKPNR